MLERKYIESFLTGSMRNMALFFSAAGRPVCRLCMQSQLFNRTCILCDTILRQLVVPFAIGQTYRVAHMTIENWKEHLGSTLIVTTPV